MNYEAEQDDVTHYFISYARRDAFTLARELHTALNRMDGVNGLDG